MNINEIPQESGAASESAAEPVESKHADTFSKLLVVVGSVLYLIAGIVAAVGIVQERVGWAKWIGVLLILPTVLVAIKLFGLSSHLAYRVGNWYRKFTMPTYIMTANASETFRKRMFWLYGPQAITVLMLWVLVGFGSSIPAIAFVLLATGEEYFTAETSTQEDQDAALTRMLTMKSNVGTATVVTTSTPTSSKPWKNANQKPSGTPNPPIETIEGLGVALQPPPPAAPNTATGFGTTQPDNPPSPVPVDTGVAMQPAPDPSKVGTGFGGSNAKLSESESAIAALPPEQRDIGRKLAAEIQAQTDLTKLQRLLAELEQQYFQAPPDKQPILMFTIRKVKDQIGRVKFKSGPAMKG